MANTRWWAVAALSGWGLILIQAFARPPANVLSIRSSQYDTLKRMWAETPPERLTSRDYLDHVERCGRADDLTKVVERVFDAERSVAETAEAIYRGDIIEEALKRNSAWRICNSQVAYGLGMSSGDLDDPQAALEVAPEAIESARRFSRLWHLQTMATVVCDAARAVKANR
jgi:hypothetical protein